MFDGKMFPRELHMSLEGIKVILIALLLLPLFFSAPPTDVFSLFLFLFLFPSSLTAISFHLKNQNQQ